MSRSCSFLCVTLCIGLFTTLCADDPGAAQQEPNLQPLNEIAIPLDEAPAPTEIVSAALPKKHFSPFTGKVKGSKVRLRLQPDLDGRVIRELQKNEVVSVVDQDGDFLAIDPPEGLKLYVFRSFVLDNVVEGNRVNVRLEPSLDAPIVAHLNSGDRIDGVVSAENSKWLEISPPLQVRFYIAQKYIEKIGGPEMKAQIERKKDSIHKLFESASLLSKAEMRKPFDEINFERLKECYTALINETDFPEIAEKAKEAFAQLQESYLQKRLSYLEDKASLTARENGSDEDAAVSISAMTGEPTDRMKMWETIEEAIYLSWARANEEKSLDQYYDQEKLSLQTVSGIVEAYNSPVKNKPGEYIVRDNQLPVAYVYSTKVDLQNLVGKRVTLKGAVRPNNNFAFPAYFVHTVE